MKLGSGALAALLAALACGSPKAPAYVREAALAESARRRAQHESAGEHYERAALAATAQRDADEARYRAAESFARAGKPERAAPIYRELLARGAGGERAARAEFALAELELKSDEQSGQALLAKAIRHHPNSGLSRRGLQTRLGYLRRQGGHDAALAYLRAEQQALSGSELVETLEYLQARELDDAGRSAAARDAYLACAAHFPYPGGAYWDDALYRAAEKELALGAARQAVLHLQRLLAEQEDASIVGSYQRSRYAEAQLLLARVVRDHLGDAERARRELRKVWSNHPTSRLADDALFEEAMLARRSGDRAGTCAPLEIIVSRLPDSRYAPCAHSLCEALRDLPGRECRAYILRDVSPTGE